MAAFATALAVAAAGAGGVEAQPATHELTATQLAGQRVVAGFRGYKPPADLLRRIRRGEVGGVILFRSNVKSRDQLAMAVRQMQSVPRPHDLDEPLLVMVDQEGGRVVRIPGAPRRSAAQIGAAGRASVARRAGRAAGRNLRGAGVNVNLAPVVDVARRGSAMERERRSYGRRSRKVARLADAFATGLQERGIFASPKHFPGFGAAGQNTDNARVRIGVPLRRLRSVDERPYRRLFGSGVRLVMLSTAIYTALDAGRPAALSPAVATDELRVRLGFDGASMTDALGTPATAPFGSASEVGVRAAEAGVDLMLYTSYGAGKRAVATLAHAIATGRIDRDAAALSVERVLDVRHHLP